MKSEYITASLKALSNFAYQTTMPYLISVEKGDQKKIVNMLPTLCANLKEGHFGTTLHKYHVEWTHVNMSKQAPSSPLDHHLLKQMCIDAKAGIKMQCSREYWLESENPRASQIFKLSKEERENLLTENLEPERYMSRIGYLAEQSAVVQRR